MTKEHKKLYKAGKNWIVATLTATTITLLGGIGTHTVHADTTIESSQDVQTTSVNQTNQVDNSNDSVTINQPAAVQSSQTAQNDQSVQGNQTNQTVPSSATAAATNNSVTINQPAAVQSSQTAQNDQSVQGNQTNQTVPSSATAAADTSNSDSLDSNIYGTVNVKDWDYQNDSNTFNLTSYHGQDTRHIIVPNLNDFDNAGVKIGNATGVGISSELARSLASQSLAFAISKTSGKYSDKVTATDNDWSSVFCNIGLINADVSNLDTRNITDMDSLFNGSTRLKTVGNLSHWDTSNVTDMDKMFSDYNGVIGGLSHWDTSNVRDMSGMFSGYEGVLGDLSHWNVSNVRDMSAMFADYNGVIGDLSHWDTSNVRNMSDMFYGYKGVIGDLSHWDTSNVTDMSYMFAFSSASVSGLNTWNIRQSADMTDMFIKSSLPYKIVASNGKSVVRNQVTLKDNTGKFLAIIDTPTIYDSNKSVKSTIDGIVQAEIDKLNKLNHTSYETPKIISDGYDDYSIANATYVVNNESQSKTGLINYVDQDGKIVKTDQVSGKVGDKVDVKLSLPDGYELANKDEQVPSTITVGDDGIKPIIINVKKIPVIKTGTINYIDPDGKVVKTDQVSGKVGDKVDVKISLPDGYELANKDEQVPSTITVGDDGIKTIIINIKKIPVIKTGTINYIDPDGKVVKTDQVSGKVGDKVDVKVSLPDGYELANKDEQVPSTITVGDDGIKTININIKKIPVIKTGTINYIDPDGKVVKTDQVSGKVGDKVDVKVSLPDGYELANKDEQVPSTITVGDDGIKTININIKKIPVIKTGTINYIDPDGKVVKTDQVSGKVGDKVDVKLSLPDGYELANKDEQVPSTITVGDDGIKTININIKKIPVIKTGTINYIDPDGKVVKTDQVSGKVGDKIDVKLSLPDGYELANKDEQVPSTITVGDDGIKTIIINIKKITGFLNLNGHTYYFGDDGIRWENRWMNIWGHSYYFKADGSRATSEITKVGKDYYYFDGQGIMQTNYFLNQKGKIYYFGNDGKEYRDRFYTNWGNKYYFGSDGARVTSSTYDTKDPEGTYYFDNQGIMKTDYFLTQNGKVYYFGKDGKEYKDQFYSNWGNMYYFGTDGARYTNQFYTNWGHTYYFGADGARWDNKFYTNWGNVYYFGTDGARWDNRWMNAWGNKYYFKSDGARATNEMVNIDGATYYFDGQGIMKTNYFLNQKGKIYYFGNDGKEYRDRFYTNWGHTYYFGTDGARYTNQFYTNWGHTYYFGADGARWDNKFYTNWGNVYYFGTDGARWDNRWMNAWGNKYYFKSDGARATNEMVNIDGATYYFDGQGIMKHDYFVTQKGKVYYFGQDGKEYRDRFYTNWGHTYYFGTDGARYTNQWSPDKKYYFGSDGAALTGQHKLAGVAYVFGADGHVKMASPVAQTNSVSVASDK